MTISFLAETAGFALETDSFALETSGLAPEPTVLSDETNPHWFTTVAESSLKNGESMLKWRIDGESKSDSPSIIYLLISKVSPKRWRMANQIRFFAHGGVGTWVPPFVLLNVKHQLFKQYSTILQENKTKL